MSEFEEALFPPDVSMSPAFALARFKLINSEYGANRVRSDVRFKKAREIWQTAVFLTGLTSLTGKEFWVSAQYQDTTPDTFGAAVIPHPTKAGAQIRELISIEVTEWEEHADGGLAETILKKLDGKRYPPYFFLLVVARRPGVTVAFPEIVVTIEKAFPRPSVSEIWVLGRPVANPAGDEHVVFRVHPSGLSARLRLTVELQRHANQKEMLSFSRGVGDDFQLIDPLRVLPLPPIDSAR